MYPDIGELIDFYERPMGQRVRRLIAHRIRARWRDVRGQTVAGLGYAPPYLGTFRGEAQRLAALMPAAQGTHAASPQRPVQAVLVEDDLLPLPDESVDRLLAVHAIEMCASPKHTLREIWRVLRPEGRLLVIVPNRRGMWAHRDTTPFGHGRPYSRGQIESLLGGAMFSIEECTFALATPPIERDFVWSRSLWLERAGSKAWPRFSGVILLEASKQMVSTLDVARRRTVRVPIGALASPARPARGALRQLPAQPALPPPSRDRRKTA
ncbi:MAG: methyltransferase domain-containing protein [Hyphomicrobiaceae bacterium]